MGPSPKNPADLNERDAEENLPEVDEEARRVDAEAKKALATAEEVLPEMAFNDPRVGALRDALKRDEADLNSPTKGHAAGRLKLIETDMQRIRADLPPVLLEEEQVEEKESSEERHPKPFVPEHHSLFKPGNEKILGTARHAHDVHMEVVEFEHFKKSLEESQIVQGEDHSPGFPTA